MDEYFERLLFRSGFTVTTFAKWLRDGAPLIALRCLELRAGYDDHWPGIQIANDQLITATGHRFNHFQIEQYSWFMQSQYSMGYRDGYDRRERDSQRLMKFPRFDAERQNQNG